MQLELKRIGRYVSDGAEREQVTIDSYKTICEAPSLLLVRVSDMEVNDEGDEAKSREIYKPVFLAACKTKFDNELLVLFYMEALELKGYVINGLPTDYPNNYRNNDDDMYIVDYKSYCDICDLTNETKMSFIDYFKIICTSECGFNSMLLHEGEELNYDKQEEFWAKQASLTK